MINLSATSPAQRWLVPVFFALILALGLLVYRDYGLTIDENQSRDNGMITLKHVAQDIAPDWVASHHDLDNYYVLLAEYFDRDYGIAFETPVCYFEQLFNIQDGGEKFLFRHLCTFLVCFGGLIAVYQLAARRFRDWRLGLLAALWLLLSPRMFAESFYNDKDAVFMALFAIATNTGVRLLLRPTVGRALWHALACAITTDVRIMGILLPLATVALLLWRGIRAEVRWVRLVTIGALYLGVMTGLIVLFWPYLWPAPLDNFLEAFEKMSTFRWGGTVLYRGEFVMANDLPWHYALVWLGITTPILYVVSGLIGLGLVLYQLGRQHWRLWRDEGGLQDIVFLGFFAGPLAAVIVLHSVLYDGWRQVYFVYPAFLLLAMRGWVAVAHWRPSGDRWLKWWPKAFYGTTALSLVLTAGQMVHDHPMQSVYFNALAGRNVGERFEMDYWGIGYREDLEYIIAHEIRPFVTVCVPAINSAYLSRLLLPVDQRERLHFTEKLEEADYFITAYRWHPEPYPFPNEVYQLRAGGRRVHSIFQLR